jgi:hypothetical protein
LRVVVVEELDLTAVEVWDGLPMRVQGSDVHRNELGRRLGECGNPGQKEDSRDSKRRALLSP